MPKVNFIVPYLSCDHDWRLYNDGRFCWSLLTAEKLLQSDYLCDISTDIKRDAINIGHARTFASLNAKPCGYIVSCDADWPRLSWANYNICQNKLNVSGKRCSWMPLFSQQGMITGSSNDRSVQNVGYFGRVDRHDEFDDFGKELMQRGFKFAVKGECNWNDYSNIDVAVSLRFLSKRRIRRKPATKLVNAWLAGVPFVAMDEAAFSQIGQSGVNYLAANSPEDVIKALIRLRDDHDLYHQLRDAGRVAAKDYTDEAVTRRWIELIEHTLVPEYEKWKASRLVESVRFNVRHGCWKAQKLLRSLLKR